MIDTTRIEKRLQRPTMVDGQRMTQILVYRLAHLREQDEWFWKFDHFEGPFSKFGLTNQRYGDLPVASPNHVDPFLPLTAEERAQVEQELSAEETDWRPTETIPEDYYAL